MVPFWRRVALCLALAAATLEPHGLRAASLDPDNAMLFDIRLEELRMGNGARGYQTGDTICVDFGDVASALDVAVDVSADRKSAAGWVFDEHRLLEIDRRRKVVKLRGGTEPLGVDDIAETSDGWCVQTDALARWLGVTIEADPLNALLLVSSDTPLPAQRARERSADASLLSARRDAQKAEAAIPIRTMAIPYRLWRTPSFDVSAEIGKGDREFARNYEVSAAGEALWMSMEARAISTRRGSLDTLRARFYRSDPDAALLGFMRATEFAFGDVTSLASRLAAQSAAGRGISLTNRPIGQASQFDMMSFQGELPFGWDVELFRNGELIGLSRGSGDGRYRFLNVPLVYGSNMFEIIRHGPQGQVRRERHVYEVGPSAVPPGEFWWSANAVEENRDLIGVSAYNHDRINWRYDLAAEFGINKRTSVAASLHSLVKNGVRHDIAEAELRRSLGTATFTLTHAMDMNGGSATKLSGLGRMAGVRFSVNSLFNRNLDSDMVSNATRASHSLTMDKDISLGRLLMPLQFDLGAISRTDGGRTRSLAARSSFSVAGISTTITAKASRTAAAAAHYGPVEGGIGLLVSGRIGQVTVRGDLNYRLGSPCSFSDANVTALWSLSDRDSWQGGAGYSWDARRASVNFGYSRTMRHFILSANASADTRGGKTALLGIRFSLGPDARGRLRRFSSDRLASNGSFDVAVFRDENGDGVRQPSEPAEVGASLQIGGLAAKAETADSGKKLVLKGLAPATPITLGVDPASLSDPLLDPNERALRVVPRKGLTVHLDLAVAASGVIEGVARDPDGAVAGGVTVILVDAAGNEVMRTTSDFDGSFVFERVRYGHYTIVMPGNGGRPQRLPVALDSRNPSVRTNLAVDRPQRSGEFSMLKR